MSLVSNVVIPAHCTNNVTCLFDWTLQAFLFVSIWILFISLSLSLWQEPLFEASCCPDESGLF